MPPQITPFSDGDKIIALEMRYTGRSNSRFIDNRVNQLARVDTLSHISFVRILL